MREIDPHSTKRAEAFELWTKAPMPMLTIFKTLDVSGLVIISKKSKYRFNALMCYCIGKAAAQTDEFYMLPIGDKLIEYDRIAVNTVVTTNDGGISTCDIPFQDSFKQFYDDYIKLTKEVRDTGRPYDAEDCMVIGTSALAEYEIDGAVNIYAGFYNNPFMIWGKYRKKLFKTELPISFQFHHAQMDGVPAARFLELLQREIRAFRVK